MPKGPKVAPRAVTDGAAKAGDSPFPAILAAVVTVPAAILCCAGPLFVGWLLFSAVAWVLRLGPMAIIGLIAAAGVVVLFLAKRRQRNDGDIGFESGIERVLPVCRNPLDEQATRSIAM